MKFYTEMKGFKKGDKVLVDTHSITHGVMEDTIRELFIQDQQVYCGVAPYPAAVLMNLSWAALSDCTLVQS